MRSLGNSNVARFGAALVALAAVVPALAARPVVNDDTRVGAPPVIAPPAAPRPLAASHPVVPTQRAFAPTALPVRAVAVPVLAVATPPKPPQPMPAPAVAKPTPSFAAEPSPARTMPPHIAESQPVREALRVPDQGSAGYHRPDHSRPAYGYQIPAEWTAPEYYISDFGSYGLSRPASGFGWSRYYDDAVLTDQWGRVYDWRDDVNWADHDQGYAGRNLRDDERPSDRKSSGRKYDQKGRWTENWTSGPGQTNHDGWHRSVRPHWSGEGYGVNDLGYGYDGGGTTVTTVVVQVTAPPMSTREISYDVVSYVPASKKAARIEATPLAGLRVRKLILPN